MESWRDIRGYEGLYQVSSMGRVRSIKRGERLMTPFVGRTGYVQLNLYKNGRVKHFYVHRLVAEAFHGAIPIGMEVNHRDGDKSNNRPGNLEIVTSQENMRHAWETGLMPRTHLAKLTEDQVREIRGLKGRARAREVAAQFGVTAKTVYLIWSGKSWRKVV